MELELVKGETIIEKGGMFQLPQNVEKIKLEKKANAKGEVRYEWEIQIIGLDTTRLVAIDKEMRDKFGY